MNIVLKQHGVGDSVLEVFKQAQLKVPVQAMPITEVRVRQVVNGPLSCGLNALFFYNLEVVWKHTFKIPLSC